MRSAIIFVFLLITFSLSARPNPEYFQQDVRYDIDVLLEGKKGILKGNYTLNYTNNSPDTLHSIFIHLYPDAYQSTKSELARENLPATSGKNSVYFARKSEKGYIKKLDFTTPRQELSSVHHEPDIAEIKLQEPLFPGDSIMISTPFQVKVPDAGFSRMGCKNQNFQITQWFPKPAVYDRKGWHQIPNRNIGEFYGEFGTFNIRLMVPENYATGSTGQRIKEERWSPAHLPGWDLDVTENVKYKTLYIKAENVHTFAWCSGKDYKRISDTLQIKSTEKTINTHILYRNDKKQWKKQLSVIRDAINFYSRKVGTYPYPQVTVAQTVSASGGGMEYPMFTLVAKTSGVLQETVIMHEIGHNWFYGALGFNERKNPWMDEGINSLYEILYMNKKYPSASLQELLWGESSGVNLMGLAELNYEDFHYLGYKMLAAKNLDKPVTLPTSEFTSKGYFINTYSKTALLLRYFYFLAGEKAFDKFVQSFWEKWKFKHPRPEDFYAHLKDHFPENGPWFINQMLQTNKHADYAIKNVTRVGDSVHISIKNKKNLEAPFDLQYGNKPNEKIRVPGFSVKETIILKKGNTDSLKINPQEILPETNRDNNTYSNFLNTDEVNLKWLYHAPVPGKKFLFHTPLLGYNMADKLMPGWLFYNDPVFSTPVCFRLAPFYSFSAQELNGEGRISYTNYSEKKHMPHWQFSIHTKRFNHKIYNEEDRFSYLKVTPELNFFLKGNTTPFAKSVKKISLRYHYLNKETYAYPDSRDFHVFELKTHLGINNVSHERTMNFNLQYANTNLKLSGEWNYDLYYDQGNSCFSVRMFAGTFLHQDKTNFDMRFRLSSWNGNKDYLYEHTMLDRSFSSLGSAPDQDQLLSHQMAIRDGGFVTRDYIQSWNYIYALNLHTNLPFDFPLGMLGIFGNLGNIGLPDGNNSYNNPNIYTEAGVTLSIWKENIRLYMPFIYNAELGYFNLSNIRFTLDLDKLNPFKIFSNIDPTLM